MKRVTSLVILASAVSALAGCASTPAASSGGAAAPASTAAAPAAAATSTAAAGTTVTTETGDKVVVPYGYKHVVMDGVDRYCRNDVEAGSRVARKQVCLTASELAEQEKEKNDYIHQVQHNGGTAICTGTPGGGGAGGGTQGGC